MSNIPYGRQDLNQDDINSVLDVLHSDFLTQGPVVPLFESAVAEYCGAKYAVAVNSSTSALHLACLSLGIGKGDIVWTSPVTFVASANCALYCGAEIDFVDIDPFTYNLSAEKLAAKLAIAKRNGKIPKLVIPVHLCGQSCDMQSIFALSLEYGFKIIEDASHAIGGRFKDEKIGNCRFSDVTVFSFHPVKIITTGEGGMALTNKPELNKKMALLRSHGITKNPSEMIQSQEGPWYYEQIDLGYNYRMTDIQAALGLSQMRRIDLFVDKRNQIALKYNSAFENSSLVTPPRDTNYSAFHLYVIRLPQKDKKNNRNEVFNHLRNQGILVNIHYLPIYHHPYYKKMNFNALEFPEAELYYKEAISLPIYPSLSDTQQKEVIDKVLTLCK